MNKITGVEPEPFLSRPGQVTFHRSSTSGDSDTKKRWSTLTVTWMLQFLQAIHRLRSFMAKGLVLCAKESSNICSSIVPSSILNSLLQATAETVQPLFILSKQKLRTFFGAVLQWTHESGFTKFERRNE